MRTNLFRSGNIVLILLKWQLRNQMVKIVMAGRGTLFECEFELLPEEKFICLLLCRSLNKVFSINSAYTFQLNNIA